jgi:hypothetical protein
MSPLECEWSLFIVAELAMSSSAGSNERIHATQWW